MKIKRQKGLTKSQKNHVRMLEEHDDFSQIVDIFRTYLEIPSGGYDYNKLVSVIPKIDKRKLQYAIGFILNRYEYPFNWFEFFSNIVVFGVATKPNVFEINYHSKKHANNPEIHLIIGEKMSKNKLKTAISDSEELDKYLKKLPRVSDLSRVTIAKQYKEIKQSQLTSDGKKLSNKKIARIRKDGDDGKRVADIKYEFKKYVEKNLEKKTLKDRIIQTISLDLK